MATRDQTPAIDRLSEALRGLDDHVQDLRGRVSDRRRRLEGELRKRAGHLETQVRKSPLYRRAERARRDLESQIDRVRAGVYDAAGIASKTEVEKLNRKLNSISRRLNELAREHEELEKPSAGP